MTRAESRKHTYSMFPKKELVDEKTFHAVIELFNLKLSNAIADSKSIGTEIGYFSVVRNVKSDKEKLLIGLLQTETKEKFLKEVEFLIIKKMLQTVKNG